MTKEIGFSSLKNVVTPEIQISIEKEGSFFPNSSSYLDADDELSAIAKFIKANNYHNSEFSPERVKFLYTTKVKKDGGRFIIGQLFTRGGLEKMINDEFDYVICVHYKAWKELDVENKVIQLDKIICGIQIDEELDPKKAETKKIPADSKEYLLNIKCYGADKVLNSSEIVDATVSRIVEQEKAQKKLQKDSPGAKEQFEN